MQKEEIGKIIYRARTDKRLTLQELADKIGVTPAAISRWENGEKSILGENLINIAIALEIVSELFPGYTKADKIAPLEKKYYATREEVEELKRKIDEILSKIDTQPDVKKLMALFKQAAGQ